MISFVKKNVAFKSVYNYVNICTEFKVCGKGTKFNGKTNII